MKASIKRILTSLKNWIVMDDPYQYDETPRIIKCPAIKERMSHEEIARLFTPAK